MINYKKTLEEKSLCIHWWNMGKKTLDFKGSYGDYLKKKGIKFRVEKGEESNILNFTISLSSSIIKLKISCSGNEFDFIGCCDRAIILFLTQLGDKTIFQTHYNKEYKLNWR